MRKLEALIRTHEGSMLSNLPVFLISYAQKEFGKESNNSNSEM